MYKSGTEMTTEMTGFGAIRIHKRWGYIPSCSALVEVRRLSREQTSPSQKPDQAEILVDAGACNSPELSDAQNLSKSINIICFRCKTRCFPYYIYSYIQKLLDQSKINLSHVALAWVYESDKLPFLYHSYTCVDIKVGQVNGSSSSIGN